MSARQITVRVPNDLIGERWVFQQFSHIAANHHSSLLLDGERASLPYRELRLVLDGNPRKQSQVARVSLPEANPSGVASMKITNATREYEAWIGHHIPVIKDQLSDKHKCMAKDPISFLRATFYRWAQLWPDVCPELAKAPAVLAVGDLHIASFGTWRDAFGRLVWGIDDFDEAYPLPYTNDLVRLAVSAVLDASEDRLAVGVRNVCDIVVEGYSAGLKSGGEPFVLEEQHKWLRKIALGHLDVPAVFWRKLDSLPTARAAIPAAARKALESSLPEPRAAFRVVRRIAGIGSLGHPRYVAVAQWKGGQIAVEAKAAVPSACVWAKPGGTKQIQYQRILDLAVRCHDPFTRLDGSWLLRRLAPDSSPIEIESMNGLHAQDRLLHAMSREAANVHLGSVRSAKALLQDVNKRLPRAFRAAVKAMTKATIKDWKEWKRT